MTNALSTRPAASAPSHTNPADTAQLDQFNPPGAVEARHLAAMYQAAQNGLRRVIALGLYCYEIKSRLKHGQFKPWLQAHCPELGYKSLAAYMGLTQSVLETCGIQMSSALDICRGGQILLSDAGVPDEAKAIREKIFAVIDGKTQRQLMLQFKTVETNPDGFLSVRRSGGDLTPRDAKGRRIQASHEQQEEVQRGQDRDAAQDLIARLHLDIISEHGDRFLSNLSPSHRRELLGTLVAASTRIRKFNQ